VYILNLALLSSTLLFATAQTHSDSLVDPNVAKAQAIAFEKQLDWDHALATWESILDRSDPPEALRFEAIAHVHDLRLRTKPADLSRRSGKPWPTLVVIFRNMKVDWKDDGGKVHHFESHFTDPEIQSIRKGFDTFCGFVSRFSGGVRHIEPTFKVVDEPVTALEGTGTFWLGPGIPQKTLLEFMKGVDFQSVFTYEKFSEGTEKLPRAFAGGTYGADVGLNEAAYSDILWDGSQVPDGEVELHEWLHQIDWMFSAVLKYPKGASVSSDMGRRVGEKEGDPDFQRLPSAINWVDFYQHIMQDHITRRMWEEATMHRPKPNPWLKLNASTSTKPG
jgi:hypothetical protein